MSSNTLQLPRAVKVIILGDSGVGKTSLLTTLTTGRRITKHVPTIGADFKLKELYVDEHIVTMQLWDTAGQERFRSIAHSYYRDVDTCVLVFDVNDSQSFDSLTLWIDEFNLHHISRRANLDGTVSKPPIVIIGNKIDETDDKRQVKPQRVKAWIDDFFSGQVQYFEVSALDDLNVSYTFKKIAETAFNYYRTTLDISPRDSHIVRLSNNGRSNDNDRKKCGC